MIEVSHLCKTYGTFSAVKDLSFTIEEGKIYGFLGPNGAGKTTTMNIITGCLAATSGEVSIGGFDIFEHPKEAKRLIGYLPELPPLYQDQTVREYLTFVANAKGFPKRADAAAQVERVAKEARVEDVIDKLIKHLSKGYRQRVGIAQALIGTPSVIILDEPTVGLDPEQIIEIRDLIHSLGEKHTVILSSHILSEVQAVCDEVLIISKGKLVAFDKVENLGKTLASGSSVEISVEASPDEIREIAASIETVSDVTIKEQSGDTAAAVLSIGENDPKTACRDISLAFAKAGKVVLQLTPVKASLENIFLELTGEDDEAAESTDEAEEAESEEVPGTEGSGSEPAEPENEESAAEPSAEEEDRKE